MTKQETKKKGALPPSKAKAKKKKTTKGKPRKKVKATPAEPSAEAIAAAEAQLQVSRMAALYLAVPVGNIQGVTGVEGLPDTVKATVVLSMSQMQAYAQRVAVAEQRARESVGR